MFSKIKPKIFHFQCHKILEYETVKRHEVGVTIKFYFITIHLTSRVPKVPNEKICLTEISFLNL